MFRRPFDRLPMNCLLITSKSGETGNPVLGDFAAPTGSKMSHIRRLIANCRPFGAVLRISDDGAAGLSGGGRMSLRQGRGVLALTMLTVLAGMTVHDAWAQPRGSASRGPALPSSGHQTEAIDLNEGKSAGELFQAGCAVCHQSSGGLAKGRSDRELATFLRQHYTSSAQHAAMLAGFLAARGNAPAAATPARGAPVDRPPASINTRGKPVPADEEATADAQEQRQDRRRRPQDPRQQQQQPQEARPHEAGRPEREAPAKRKPSEKQQPATARTAPAQAPAAPTPAAAATPVAADSSAPAESSTPPAASAASPAMSTPPVEEKPVPPQIPL